MAAVTQLGYLGFEVSDLEAWHSFATGVLGLSATRRADGVISLRNDSREARFFLVEGEADDLAFMGWQVEDAAGLDQIARRLQGAGVTVTEGEKAEAEARCVDRLIRFEDPAGLPVELFCGPHSAAEPFASELVRSGFVAEEQGVGHLVIGARSQAESLTFYTEMLGFSLSDFIKCELYGYKVDIAFLHANRRHHSLAFGGPMPKRIHHFMLQVGAMDDVGLAYDRAIRARVPIAQTLGRHPNDRMFSFYAHTPSGFQFEYGWGAIEVDDDTWEPTTHDCVSEWGHHPPQLIGKRGLRREES